MSDSDTGKYLKLLKRWHRYAAQYSDAPSHVRCVSCDKLIGTIYEPDGIRLPSEATYLNSKDAYSYTPHHYAPARTAGQYRGSGKNYVYNNEGIALGKGNRALRYRIEIPSRLICPHCEHINIPATSLLMFSHLSEIRKLARRITGEESRRVSEMYRVWRDSLGGRAVPACVNDEHWPYAPARDIRGWLTDEDVRDALIQQFRDMPNEQQYINDLYDDQYRLPKMVSARQEGDKSRQEVDARRADEYNTSNLTTSIVVGVYRYK